ncbi:protein asteroid [Trichuris trichiura]|uniref:Protein asteroid n=1 Tax=Trichuris trichiura TaxID=36087 RepID=A0A077Z2C7_TRITR|nr:protein asteroid [Trichuris trichiura]
MVACGCLLTACLLVVSFLNGASGDQACTGEFNKFKGCMSGAFDRLIERSNVESKLEQAKQCFEKNHCNTTGPPFSPGSSGHQCKKQVFEELGQKVETCVKDKFPGFTFSDLFLKKKPGGGKKGGGFPMPFGGRRFGKYFRVLRDPNVCPAEVKDQVTQCLKPIVSEGKKAMKGYITELCAEKDKCMTSMSPTCKQEFNSLKKEVVNCACGQLEPNAAKYAHELLSCLGKTDRPNETYKKMVEGFIPKFCKRMRENPDICQNLEQFFARHHHHHHD